MCLPCQIRQWLDAHAQLSHLITVTCNEGTNVSPCAIPVCYASWPGAPLSGPALGRPLSPGFPSCTRCSRFAPALQLRGAGLPSAMLWPVPSVHARAALAPPGVSSMCGPRDVWLPSQGGVAAPCGVPRPAWLGGSAPGVGRSASAMMRPRRTSRASTPLGARQVLARASHSAPATVWVRPRVEGTQYVALKGVDLQQQTVDDLKAAWMALAKLRDRDPSLVTLCLVPCTGEEEPTAEQEAAATVLQPRKTLAQAGVADGAWLVAVLAVTGASLLPPTFSVPPALVLTLFLRAKLTGQMLRASALAGSWWTSLETTCWPLSRLPSTLACPPRKTCAASWQSRCRRCCG